jgi:UDP-N-acetylglucosamine diphosphorylase/glucosamine-1-phosphate N-acetyltransferase
MNYILFDGDVRTSLLPFTFTRPVADIRVGITTLREKWEVFLKAETSSLTEDYLQEKFPLVLKSDNVFINGSLVSTKQLADCIQQLEVNQKLVDANQLIIAYRATENLSDLSNFDTISFSENIIQIKNTWDIFEKNDEVLRQDFASLSQNRQSQPIPKTVQTLGEENIFIEDGAKMNFVTLNASTGPIYIGKNAEIMEGSVIRGPFALCEEAVVKLSAKLYGATTIGPHCKVGGEVSNSVIFGYSNKGHDGFLGNSVLGEWCNIGADSNNSNLKNNYEEVKLWSYETENFAKTGLQFCGLMMGDHSKCGINTMFNTGTVVGVSANIFGSGFPRNFVPSFSWGGAAGFTTYLTKKAFEVAKVVMSRRKVDFTAVDQRLLEKVFELSSKWRKD